MAQGGTARLCRTTSISKIEDPNQWLSLGSPVSAVFGNNTIAGIAGFYNIDDKRYHVIVGTTGGKVHDIYWKSDTVGVEANNVYQVYSLAIIL